MATIDDKREMEKQTEEHEMTIDNLNLRDQFAIASLNTLGYMQLNVTNIKDVTQMQEAFAEFAYGLADIMLAERAKPLNRISEIVIPELKLYLKLLREDIVKTDDLDESDRGQLSLIKQILGQIEILEFKHGHTK